MQQISVSFLFDNPADAQALLAKVAGSFAATTTTASAEKPASTEKAATTKKGADKAASSGKASAPQVDRSAVNAVLMEIKELSSIAEARAIFQPIAKVEKMGEIPEDKLGEVLEAAKAKLAELRGEPGSGDDGL